MKRSLLLAAVLAVALVAPTSALAVTSPAWNLNGEYSIDFTCTSGCLGDYPHTMNVTFTDLGNGQVAGTGHNSDTWTMTGTIAGTGVTFHIDYDNSTYTVDMIGAIAADGSMSGTASSNAAHGFNWATTAGAAYLMPQSVGDCAPGTYAGFNHLWTGFVSSVGTGSDTPVVTTPFDLQPGLTYRIEASGTYFAGGTTLWDIEADAEYSQDQFQRDNNLGWTDEVHNYGIYGEGLLELVVNDTVIEWGAFSSTHRYTSDVSGLAGPASFSFAINDIYAQNNTGGLCVAVYAAPYYAFAGFFAPIDNLPTMNVVKAGSAIPVKFSLDGDRGLNVFAAGYPTSYTIDCDSGTNLDPIEETVTAGGSSLTYDAIADQYTYVWKTAKTWAATCRQLEVKLADGESYFANFKFK